MLSRYNVGMSVVVFFFISAVVPVFCSVSLGVDGKSRG